MSDWEQQNRERLEREAVDKEVVNQYPALPKPGGLIRFDVEGIDGLRFFVDGQSILLADGGVVRYTLVARSPQGAENITYEGARCSTGEHRIYAAAFNGAWQPRATPWRPMAQRWEVVLHREYFCAQAVPIRSAAEGVRALENGGHPFYRGFAAEPNPRRR